MTIDIGDKIRITARMTFAGVNDVQNVYHVSASGGASETDANFMAAMSAFLEARYGSINITVSDAIAYLDILGFNITKGLPLVPVGWGFLTQGLDTSEPTSPQVSPTVIWRTNRARSIARKFLPITGEANLDAGLLSTALLTNLANFAAAFIGNIPMGLVNVQFITLNKLTGLAATYENSIVPVDTRTQRRRRRSVGS